MLYPKIRQEKTKYLKCACYFPERIRVYLSCHFSRLHVAPLTSARGRQWSAHFRRRPRTMQLTSVILINKLPNKNMYPYYIYSVIVHNSCSNHFPTRDFLALNDFTDFAKFVNNGNFSFTIQFKLIFNREIKYTFILYKSLIFYWIKSHNILYHQLHINALGEKMDDFITVSTYSKFL